MPHWLNSTDAWCDQHQCEMKAVCLGSCCDFPSSLQSPGKALDFAGKNGESSGRQLVLSVQGCYLPNRPLLSGVIRGWHENGFY